MKLDRASLRNLKRDRDILAAVFSIVPGAGHIFKGHYAAGLAILLLGVPVALWVGILLSLATAGVGLLIPLAAWAIVVMSAYYASDHRKHHWKGVS